MVREEVEDPKEEEGQGHQEEEARVPQESLAHLPKDQIVPHIWPISLSIFQLSSPNERFVHQESQNWILFSFICIFSGVIADFLYFSRFSIFSCDLVPRSLTKFAATFSFSYRDSFTTSRTKGLAFWFGTSGDHDLLTRHDPFYIICGHNSFFFTYFHL